MKTGPTPGRQTFSTPSGKLALHSLRAADALQLASALVAVGDQPQGFEFVTFDETLAEAAEKEGFRILP